MTASHALSQLSYEGFKVSVNSGNVDELRRGARAGADYVLSLDESSLDAIDGTKCVPILLPRPHGDLDSLLRAIDMCVAKGIPHIADPVLDPINFGFMTSLERYAQLRRARPDVEILMGTGNLTELTDADSGGVTAMLIGICAELGIRNVLIVQVSPHTRRTVEEHDAARRLMYRAREDNNLPKGYGNQLLSLHDVRPIPIRPSRSRRTPRTSRMRTSASRPRTTACTSTIATATTSLPIRSQLFDKLGVEKDGAHAFYLGYELAKAEIARALGKRYAQDGPLDWGVAADRKVR